MLLASRAVGICLPGYNGPVMPNGRGVFISHITDEAPIADALKVYLKRCFGPDLPVFVSSDYVSIPTGDEWYRAILDGVMEADLFIVLLSRDSIDRRWINFESGLAIGAGRRVVPLTVRGLSSGDVGLPLSQMHLRSLVDELALEGVVQAVADATATTLLVLDDPSSFIAQLTQIEATLPMKSIVLDPMLQHRPGGVMLRFRLSDTGNRDVELIEIEVSVPKLLCELNWLPSAIPNVLSYESSGPNGTDCWITREQPFAGVSNEAVCGPFNALPRVVSPHGRRDSPISSKCRFAPISRPLG